ncbi:MAG: addiction module protein [Opitutaceae bacterium]|nr:addiction module protein [Opitutaceae bacterium]
MTIDQIVEESRSLPQDMVAELVDRILLASHGGQEVAHSKVWPATVHKRIADIRAGKAHGIPWEKTSEKIKRIVGR